jgi:hypothetical protein
MHGRVNIVQKVVARVIHYHSHSTQWDDLLAKFKRHLNDRTTLVKVFEGSESNVLSLV